MVDVRGLVAPFHTRCLTVNPNIDVAQTTASCCRREG